MVDIDCRGNGSVSDEDDVAFVESNPQASSSCSGALTFQPIYAQTYVATSVQKTMLGQNFTLAQPVEASNIALISRHVSLSNHRRPSVWQLWLRLQGS